MIIICIILLIPLLFLLVKLVKKDIAAAKEELKKNPWRYQKRPKRRRHPKSDYTYTGLPWMGGKKIRKD